MNSKKIKELLLNFNNERTNQISLDYVDNDTERNFTLKDMQRFAKICIREDHEQYRASVKSPISKCSDAKLNNIKEVHLIDEDSLECVGEKEQKSRWEIIIKDK